MKILVLSLLSLLSFSAVAQPVPSLSLKAPKKETKRFQKAEGKLGLRLNGTSLGDNYVKSRNSMMIMNPDFEVDVNSWLSGKLDFSAILSAGSGSDFYDSGDAKNFSGLSVDEASVTLKPFSFLSARAGILQFYLNDISTVMSDNSYMGVEEKIQAGKKEESHIGISSMQAIPSGPTMTGVVTDNGDNPSFLLNKFFAQVQPFEFWSVRAQVAQFKYTNLSSGLANASRFVGNTVNGLGAKAAQFAYEFAGYEYGAGTEVKFSESFSTEVKGSYILNEKADVGYRAGRKWEIKPTLVVGDFTWMPFYGMFRVESDATPGVYSLPNQRLNNREGEFVGLNVKMNQEEIIFKTKYTKANVIEDSAYQADREIYFLGLETNYELF